MPLAVLPSVISRRLAGEGRRHDRQRQTISVIRISLVVRGWVGLSVLASSVGWTRDGQPGWSIATPTGARKPSAGIPERTTQGWAFPLLAQRRRSWKPIALSP